MKHRFETGEKVHTSRNLIISVIICAVVIALFYFAFSSVSAQTVSEERAALEMALNRSITHCYAIEGHYPESLDYIKENYGLTYDESLFYVVYHPLGENLMPDVTIIERKGDAS